MSRVQIFVRVVLPVVLLCVAVILMVAPRLGMVYPGPGTESKVLAAYRIPNAVLNIDPRYGAETFGSAGADAHQDFASHHKETRRLFVATTDIASIADKACLDLADALREYGAKVTAAASDKGRRCRYEYSLGNSRGTADIDVQQGATRNRPPNERLIEGATPVELRLRIEENWYKREG